MNGPDGKLINPPSAVRFALTSFWVRGKRMRYSARVRTVCMALVGVLGVGVGAGVMMSRREDRLLQERMDRLAQADMTAEKPSSFAESKAMVAAIAKADTVAVWEGLPHPMWEKHLLAMELLNKKTIKLHDFPFYQDPLDLSVEDGEQLIALFRDPDLFQKPMIGKLCGGFHPDYRLVFRAGTSTYEVLICFGCHEALLFGPSADSYCDLQEHAYQRFQGILKRYRKNRPSRRYLSSTR